MRQALLALTAALLAAAPVAAATATSETKLEAALSGAAERPKGDPDGTGHAAVTVKGTRLCWEIRVFAIGKPLAAHVHKGGPGVASGPVVVPLGGAFRAKGCTTVTSKLAAALSTDPARYYVNVHTAAFSKGAVRGQLARAEREPGY